MNQLRYSSLFGGRGRLVSSSVNAGQWERFGCERRMVFFKRLFHFQITDCKVVIERILVLKNEVGEQLIKDLGDLFNVQAHRWRLSSLVVGNRRMLVPEIFRTSCSPC